MTFFSAKTRPLFAHGGTGFTGFGVGAGAGAGVVCGLGGLRTSLVTAEGGAGSANDTFRESSADGVAAETTRGEGAATTYQKVHWFKQLGLTRAAAKPSEIQAEFDFLCWRLRCEYRQPDRQSRNCFFDRSECQVCELEQ
jgi:hypothetical protein